MPMPMVRACPARGTPLAALPPRSAPPRAPCWQRPIRSDPVTHVRALLEPTLDAFGRLRRAKAIVSGHADGSVRVWAAAVAGERIAEAASLSTPTGSALALGRTAAADVCAMVVSSELQQIWTGHANGRFHIWSVLQHKQPAGRRRHSISVVSQPAG